MKREIIAFVTGILLATSAFGIYTYTVTLKRVQGVEANIVFNNQILKTFLDGATQGQFTQFISNLNQNANQ